LRRYRDVIGAAEADRLEREYKDAWLALLERYFKPARKQILFGRDLTKVEDRLNVTIPPPCEPEALAKAKEEVKKLLEKK